MTAPLTQSDVQPITPPMTRLQAVVLLRRTLQKLRGHLPAGGPRELAATVLQDTSHVQTQVHPSLFGWAIKPAGASAAAWVLEFDSAKALQSTQARDDAGVPLFEVIGLAPTAPRELPTPKADAEKAAG
jgi:hypothetical protein